MKRIIVLFVLFVLLLVSCEPNAQLVQIIKESPVDSDYVTEYRTILGSSEGVGKIITIHPSEFFDPEKGLSELRRKTTMFVVGEVTHFKSYYTSYEKAGEIGIQIGMTTKRELPYIGYTVAELKIKRVIYAFGNENIEPDTLSGRTVFVKSNAFWFWDDDGSLCFANGSIGLPYFPLLNRELLIQLNFYENHDQDLNSDAIIQILNCPLNNVHVSDYYSSTDNHGQPFTSVEQIQIFFSELDVKHSKTGGYMPFKSFPFRGYTYDPEKEEISFLPKRD